MLKNLEPTPEEISKSIYYIRIKESFSIFQQSSDIQTFLKDINFFISSEPNKNLIEYTISPMIHKILQISTKSSFNQDNTILIFNILDQCQVALNINYGDFIEFFFSVISTPESIDIIKNHTEILEKLFSDENFFSSFVEQQRTTTFFEKAFINSNSVEFCILFRHLICEISPLKIRAKINLSKILSFLTYSIPQEIQIEYSIVLSKLVSISHKNRLFLNNDQAFFHFSRCIQSASSETVKNCFDELVFTEPANLNLFSCIILFYQKYYQHQNPLFQWIFNDVIQNHNGMLNEINQIVPFFEWVTLNTKVGDVIDGIISLSKYDDDFTSSFISPLFALLNKSESNFEEYRFIIQLIERQILLHHITLLDLLNSHFLETFIINLKIDLIGELFEKIYTFSQLVYDVFTLPKSGPLRSSVIKKLIQMAGKFRQNSHFISIFLVASNSIQNISDLMKAIIENKNGDLCIALGDSFVKSNSVINYFINENGIEYLDRVFNMKIIDLKQFVFLLNSLTKNFYIQKVDDYIESLPRYHPIFSLGLEDLMLLSYGFEKSHYFYPLKLTSLFHLLKCPQIIDPYNAYMIGKHVFEKIVDVDDLPILSEIVNRYINDKAFQKLIDMNPNLFESFCDSNFDHFPLFQVNEFFDNNVFNVKFKAISFWFKFGDTFMQELKIPFFITGKFHLFMKNDSLLANYEGIQYDTQVDPLKWNNIIILVSSGNDLNYIEVHVNLNKAVFTSQSILNELNCFEFTTYSAFLFIGPSIRIYQNELMINDIEAIYKNGVSFTDHLNETAIISPSSTEFFQLRKNVFKVEYSGFPYHFLSKEKRNLLYKKITDSSLKQNEFNSLISAYYKAYSILENSMNDFLNWVLSIFSEVPQFVNVNIFVKLINLFLKKKNKSEIIDTIIGNKRLWSNVPNCIIIMSLFSAFKNFDFYKEKKKLDVFFCVKSYFITEKTKIFEYLIQSSKKCQLIIHDMLNGSYFLTRKQDKFAQCNLTKNFKSNRNEQNNEVIINDQKDASIQCNLLNEEIIECFDSFCLFQTTKMTSFQKVFIDFLNRSEITKNAINLIPIDSIYNIFITSDTENKSLLFSILLKCEKMKSNLIQFDSTFLIQISSLFNYKNVWTVTFNSLTSNEKEITDPSYLPFIFSLLWGFTVSSLHSIASTGKEIHNANHDEILIEINRIVNFLSLENNLKIATKDKNVLKFVVNWFPFLFGINSKNIDFFSQFFKFNDLNDHHQNPVDFVTMIWMNIIKETEIPFNKNKEFNNEIEVFIVRSKIFGFYFKFILFQNNSNFNEVLSTFLSISFFSENKELANHFVECFLHSFLNIIAGNSSYTSKINLVFPFVHFLSITGRINFDYLPIILSDLLLISSVIYVCDQLNFNEMVSGFNLLILNLFFSILKFCENNKIEFVSIINVLYQILYHQNKLLIQLASESQIIIDMYLDFFRQTSQFCSNKEIYQKIVTKLGNALKIEQTPQFQSILIENIQTDSNLDLTKWNGFIKMHVIPLIDQNTFNFNFLTSIKEYSKSYSYSFLNALDKQIQISIKLPELFEESEKFQESKSNWNKSVYNEEDNIIDSSDKK